VTHSDWITCTAVVVEAREDLIAAVNDALIALQQAGADGDDDLIFELQNKLDSHIEELARHDSRYCRSFTEAA